MIVHPPPLPAAPATLPLSGISALRGARGSSARRHHLCLRRANRSIPSSLELWRTTERQPVELWSQPAAFPEPVVPRAALARRRIGGIGWRRWALHVLIVAEDAVERGSIPSRVIRHRIPEEMTGDLPLGRQGAIISARLLKVLPGRGVQSVAVVRDVVLALYLREERLLTVGQLCRLDSEGLADWLAYLIGFEQPDSWRYAGSRRRLPRCSQVLLVARRPARPA